MTNTVMGLFDDSSTAEKVKQELTSSGFDSNQVDLTKEDSAGELRDDLVKQGVAKDEADYYVQGISQGGALVTVQADADKTDEAVAIMNRYADEGDHDEARTESVDTRETERAGSRDEEVITTAEEQIKVGKRAVSQGGKRIRTYVSETPVEEQVTLRDETVTVERHDVENRPVSDADGDLFQERTIEMTETDEEAVVSKEARITGEVVVEKDVTEHTETVKDTVRRTEVEVEETGTETGKRNS